MPLPGSYAAVGRLRPSRPSVLLIGASTGGPQAIITLLSRLAPVLRNAASAGAPGCGAEHRTLPSASVPVCITLHMPRDLVPVIAAHVARRCGIATGVVDRPCLLAEGQVYFAPGDRHLGFERGGAGVTAVPLPPAQRGHVAVDAMFAAAAAAYGVGALGIVLSGMGEDGLAGAHAIVAGGGTVLVQDRASSAVWGMPGAVVRAGLAAQVLSPVSLAGEVIRCLDGGEASARPPVDLPRPASATGSAR